MSFGPLLDVRVLFPWVQSYQDCLHGLRVFDPRDAECLLARVLEGCTDEVGLRVVQDDEAVVEGLRAPDRKFGVLGVEGLDVFGSELGFGVGLERYGDAVVFLCQDVEGACVGVAVNQDD